MANFDLAIDGVLANEGGYSNNPNDPGGETKYGISARAYPGLEINTLSQNDAKIIYHRDYWKFDCVLSQDVANKILDTVVNLGPSGGMKLIQQCCVTLGSHVNIDGVWGPATCNAVNSHPDGSLLPEIRAELSHYYTTLVAKNPSDYQFLRDWLRRAAQ